jgi:hypothetical protein
MNTTGNIRASIVNGIIILSVDEHDLLTMNTFTKAEYEKLQLMGIDKFRALVDSAVHARFNQVKPYFKSEADRATAIDLVIAKLAEVPGSSGIQQDVLGRHL